jgi:hypothetical protein
LIYIVNNQKRDQRQDEIDGCDANKNEYGDGSSKGPHKHLEGYAEYVINIINIFAKSIIK